MLIDFERELGFDVQGGNVHDIKMSTSTSSFQFADSVCAAGAWGGSKYESNQRLLSGSPDLHIAIKRRARRSVSCEWSRRNQALGSALCAFMTKFGDIECGGSTRRACDAGGWSEGGEEPVRW